MLSSERAGNPPWALRYRPYLLILLGLLAEAAAGQAGRPGDNSPDRRGGRLIEDLDPPAPTTLYGPSSALVIGIANYTSSWPDPPDVHSDVTEIGHTLEELGFQVSSGIDLGHRELDQKIREFIAERGQDPTGRVLIYFTGHGQTLEQSFGGKMGYLVPADAPRPPRDQPGFIRYALSMDQLEVYAKTIQSKHALFVLDSRLATPNLTLPTTIMAESIGHKVRRPVRQFIISDREHQFGQRFVAALKGAGDRNGDGFVTGTELGEFLNRPTLTIFHPQLAKGDFVFPLPAELASKIPPSPEPSTRNGETHPRVAPPPPTLSPPRSPSRGSEWTEPVLGIRMRFVPAGTHRVGSPKAERGRGRSSNEKPRNKRLRYGFWMGETEITQAQWQELMGTNPAKHQRCGKHCPIESVNWWEVARFANRLSQKSGLDTCYVLECKGMPGQRVRGQKNYHCENVRFRGSDCAGYRLPISAEWEIAARANTSTATYAGDLTMNGRCKVPELDAIAWYCGNSRSSPRLVGEKKANAWGLHDMLGNVSEWVGHPESKRAKFRKGAANLLWPLAVFNGRHPGPYIRGGSYQEGASACRAAAQSRSYSPSKNYNSVGFRIVRTSR